MAARQQTANYRLAQLLIEAGFTSHKAFARAVRTVSAEPPIGRPVGCDHTSVSRWLQGMQPRGDTAVCITAALGLALGRPVTMAEAGLTASAVPLDLGLQGPPALEEGIATLTRLWRADLDEAAPILTRPASPAVWQQVPLTWLLARPAGEASLHREGSRVGPVDVVRVRAATDLFVQLDNRYGGGHARRALIQYLASDVTPLLTGRGRARTGAELFSAAGEATRLAAWMSYDAGLHGLAQRYFVQALGLAEAAGDRLLAGSVLDAMSHQATFLGRFRDAANLARAALAGTQHAATPALSAHFHVMEARALARLGDTRGCELALSQAVTLFERRNPDDEPDWFQYFDDAELAAEFGHCYRDAGRPARAASYAAQSLGSADGTFARSDFFAAMVLADAHLRAGDAEQACQVALGALRLGEQLQSARCESYVAGFHADLAAARGSPAVRDFQAQAAAFTLWRRATGPERG